MAQLDTDELAQVAYAAYGESVDHRNLLGHPMPEWAELTEPIRAAWTAAAAAVARAATTRTRDGS
ncbi:hypothetical protein P3L51_24405 [Streptomyces sp. PSRA5]|uniref:hypothetical protein n=1 Tax=Streptomyces panacea TaxID=3035064 RepID=UPI00339C03E2